MQLQFQAIAEDQPGAKWQAYFERLWPAYKRWYLQQGDQARPSYAQVVRALRQHMPELLPTYQRLTELAGGEELAARFLSFYCPPPYLTACSQLIWLVKPRLLIRNYDYNPKLFEGVVLRTKWNKRRVLATSDCLWGVLDGLNDAGLAVSLTFGGRRVVGRGFGVPVILRYVLEFCDNVDKATKVLSRIPTHMAYNVSLLDRQGRYATVYIAPDRAAVVSQAVVATNHQRAIEWSQYAEATASLERERYLIFRLREASDKPDELVQAFLQPPVHSRAYKRGFGTLYTAVLQPGYGSLTYLWPNARWRQSLQEFESGNREIQLLST